MSHTVPVCHLDGGFSAENQEFGISVLCFHTSLDCCQYHISGPEKGMVPEHRGSLGGKSMS